MLQWRWPRRGWHSRSALSHGRHPNMPAELARSIATTEAEVSEVRLALESAGSLAETLGQGRLLSTRSQYTAHPIYQIVRQGREGPVVLPAQENTPLLPDDVLQVGQGTASRIGSGTLSWRRCGSLHADQR